MYEYCLIQFSEVVDAKRVQELFLFSSLLACYYLQRFFIVLQIKMSFIWDMLSGVLNFLGKFKF